MGSADTVVRVQYSGIQRCDRFSKRDCVVQVPASYTGKTAVPLVIVLHGYDTSADAIESFSGFTELGEKKGFITAYPQGTLSAEGKSGWNAGGTFWSKRYAGTERMMSPIFRG